MFNKNKIVFAVDKIKLDNPKESLDTSTIETTTDKDADLENELAKTMKENSMFKPTLYAYAVYKLENRKYDIFKVGIDPETSKSVAERLGKNWDSENRAYMEMQSLMAADLIAKRKEEFNQNKGKHT